MELETIIDGWLALLQGEQRRAVHAGFPSGSMPSYRRYPVSGLSRADPNVFFPALVACKLTEWQSVMSQPQREKAEVIKTGITGTFELYKSRRGRMHYNFWPTQPDVAFPNGRLLHRFDFFRLPDDIDDTALVYKARQAETAAVAALQADIETHLSKHYPGYPKIYPAWLGDRMPWVTDVCAMTNLLGLFGTSGLTDSVYLVQSEQHLSEVVRKSRWRKAPYHVAPYYPDTAVVAYHLARWLADSRERNQLADTFLKDVQDLSTKELRPFKKMLYHVAQLRLGVANNKLYDLDLSENELHRYPWFFGSMLSAVKPAWLRKAGGMRLFQIAHYCSAWNASLVAEYHILKKLMAK